MLDRLDGQMKHGVESIAILENGEEMSMSEAEDLANKNELTEVNFKYSLLQVPRIRRTNKSIALKILFLPNPAISYG